LPISALENVISSAEQRAVRNREKLAVARIVDVYSAIPAMTGKFELEYEGEQRGAENIARELIRAAVGKVFTRYFSNVNLQPVVQWFELGGDLKVAAQAPAVEHATQLRKIQGLFDNLEPLSIGSKTDPAIAAAAAEFVLEGLWAHKRISRSEERGFYADARKAAAESRETPQPPGRMPRRQFN